MRKICKIIIACILFCIITIQSLGTTDILPENKFGIKKATILVAGVFLVVQILFIAYKIDKNNEILEDTQEINLNKDESVLDFEKNQKEDKELFKVLKTNIETLPDIKSPKKRNLKLKKENKGKKNLNEIFSRKNVKIIRERKERSFDLNKDIIKLEAEAKKIKTKFETEEKKKLVKNEVKIKKQNLKEESKKRKPKNA